MVLSGSNDEEYTFAAIRSKKRKIRNLKALIPQIGLRNQRYGWNPQ